MAINKVSQETREAIKRKSVFSLPDRPSDAGMKAKDIKRAFYEPVTDAALSALGEVDRVVDEVNDALEKRDAELEKKIEPGDGYIPDGQLLAWDAEQKKLIPSGIHKDAVPNEGKSGNVKVVEVSFEQVVFDDMRTAEIPFITREQAEEIAAWGGACCLVEKRAEGTVENGRFFTKSVMIDYIDYKEMTGEGQFKDSGAFRCLLRADDGRDIVVEYDLNGGFSIGYLLKDVYETERRLNARTDAVETGAEERLIRMEEAFDWQLHETDIRFAAADAALAKRVENLEYAAKDALYADVTAEGTAYAAEIPEEPLPYASLSMIGGRSYVRERNVIKMPYHVKTNRTGGVLRTVFPDGTVTIEGTASSNQWHWLRVVGDQWLPPKGTYFFSCCPAGGSQDTYYAKVGAQIAGTTKQTAYIDTGDGIEIQITDEYDALAIGIFVAAGRTVNITFRPQLELGTAATPFEPFTIKNSPVSRGVFKGRNLGGFGVKEGEAYISSVKKITDTRFVYSTLSCYDNNTKSKPILERKGLEIGKRYTVVIMRSDENSLIMNNNIGVLQGGIITSNSGYLFAKTFIATEDTLLIEASVGKYTKNSVDLYIELWEGEAAALKRSMVMQSDGWWYDITPSFEFGAVPREDVTAFELPTAFLDAHKDTYGYSVNGEGSYIDFENGTYHAKARRRTYQDGDFGNATVLTDGVNTIESWDEVDNLEGWGMDGMVSLANWKDPYDRLVFENENEVAVPYTLKYQKKLTL